jgi:general secretion pathway protein G
MKVVIKVPRLCAVSAKRRKSHSGFSLVELIVAFSIVIILSSMAVPLARYQVRRQRERDLLSALNDMRSSIDRYKDMCDQGKIQAGDLDGYCYPKSLKAMVDGVPQQNTISGNGQNGKIKFLRRIPRDPFSGDTEWGIRSMQDDPTSTSWGGQNVFDVYTKANDKASDGKPYSEW